MKTLQKRAFLFLKVKTLQKHNVFYFVNLKILQKRAFDFLNMKMGTTIRTFNIGDINETTVYSPDGTGQVFTPNFSIIGATASKKLSDNTSVGLNANYIRESFGRVAASGMAFDLGVQYKGLASMEGLDVGFVLRNFGQPVKYETNYKKSLRIR